MTKYAGARFSKYNAEFVLLFELQSTFLNSYLQTYIKFASSDIKTFQTARVTFKQQLQKPSFLDF